MGIEVLKTRKEVYVHVSNVYVNIYFCSSLQFFYPPALVVVVYHENGEKKPNDISGKNSKRETKRKRERK